MKHFIVTIFLLPFWSHGVVAQVAVIANKSVPVDQISSAELLDFYSGDVRTWGNDDPVIVFDLKSKGGVKDTFYEFLGKSTSRMKSIWMKNLLSGEGEPPESLKSEEEVVEKVANTPGAIGFVSQSKTTQAVKVLAEIPMKK